MLKITNELVSSQLPGKVTTVVSCDLDKLKIKIKVVIYFLFVKLFFIELVW